MQRLTRLARLAIGGAFAGALLIAAPSAHATLQMTTAPLPGGLDNVLFNACGAGKVGQGTTVTGCLNSDHEEYVDFKGTEVLTMQGGQASIDALDGTFNDVTISLQDQTVGFSELSFNIDAVADGNVHFVAIDQFGNQFDFDFALDGSGQNRFTLFSNDNQVGVSLQMIADVQVENNADLTQVRLDLVNRTDVPEPASLALLGGALVGLGLLRRRRRTVA